MRVGNKIRYYRNSELLREVEETNPANMMADFTFYQSGARIYNPKIVDVAYQHGAQYIADVKSYSDFYSFGMLKPGRHGGESYRYGYQGSESDNEVKGSGNSYTTHFRQLDTRIGRWLSIDPKTNELPWESPYVSMGNTPIWANDPMGDKFKVKKGDEKAKKDVNNLVKTKNKAFLKHNEDTELFSLDFGDLEQKKINKILSKDKGLNLIKDLIDAEETILYEVTNERTFKIRTSGIVRNFTADNTLSGAIHNISKTPRNFNGGAGSASAEPADPSIEGHVFISPGEFTLDRKIRYPDGSVQKSTLKLSRSSVVFHELAENYARTVLKEPYIRLDSKRSGAHQYAIDREKGSFNHPKPGHATGFNPSK